MSTANFGVICGRFQLSSLHDGHRALLDTVGKLHPRVIVFLGCLAAGVAPTKHDPLDFEVRKRMILKEYPNYDVYPIYDQKTDEAWSKHLDQLMHEHIYYGSATLYGGRDSFVPHYTGKHKVVDLTLTIPKSVSGTTLRVEVSNKVLESADFRAGIIYGMMNSYDRVIPTVDIAIIYKGEPKPINPNGDTNFKTSGIELLLAKRDFEKGWRFPGGHAMGKNVSYEHDAKMESIEETANRPETLTYIGSTIIDDWRYKNTPEMIKTIFFLGEASSLSTTGGDDVAITRFFPIEVVTEDMIEPEHKVLFAMLKKYLKV